MSTEPGPDIERVYRDESIALLRLAFLLTGSRDLAEDIVQTAFAAAQARWAKIDDPLAYLRRVVVNQANDAHRRRYRRAPHIIEGLTSVPDIDETWVALRRLPPRQRPSWSCASTRTCRWPRSPACSIGRPARSARISTEPSTTCGRPCEHHGGLPHRGPPRRSSATDPPPGRRHGHRPRSRARRSHATPRSVPRPPPTVAGGGGRLAPGRDRPRSRRLEPAGPRRDRPDPDRGRPDGGHDARAAPGG